MLRSVSDAIITINNQVKVHRSLLLDVSDKMRHLVEQMEERQVQAASQDRGPAIDHAPGNLSVLDHTNEPGAERGLVLWSSFLYGQPMSVSLTELAKEGHDGHIELFALRQAHKIALKYDHSDAEDASIDAMRDLLYQDVPSTFMPFTEIIIPTAFIIPIITDMFTDFVVYGKHEQGFRYTGIVDACTGILEDISDPAMSAWLMTLSEEQTARVRRDLLRLSNELLKMFIQKGKDERDGVPAPDLMARCRYHSHMAKGQPCYMDK